MDQSSQDFVISSCLDRLKLYAQRPADNEEQIKNLTSKMLARMKLQEKISKELSNKCSLTDFVGLLVLLLQGTENICIIGNIVSILHDLLEQKACKRHCQSALLANDAVSTLVKLLPLLTREMCPEHLLPGLFFIMAKLSHKDNKFAMKARYNNGLQALMIIMKSHIRHTMLLRYMMQIMKVCVLNATNCNLLVKEGIIPVSVEILSCIGRKPTYLLKLTLDTIGLVTKHGSNVGKLIRCNGLQRILHVLEQWMKYDISNRKRICISGLTVLSHIADLRYGQKSITDAGGIQILYQLCLTMPRSREYDRLLTLSSTVIQKCLPQKTLPINSMCGPYTFPVPSSKAYSSTIELKKNIDLLETSEESQKTLNDTISSSEDEKEELTSDTEESDHSEASFASDIIVNRTEWNKDEISAYKKFFCELEGNFMVANLNVYSAKSIPNSLLQSDVNLATTQRTLSSSVIEGIQSIHLSSESQTFLNRQEVYRKLASSTRHVANFTKLAYPDLHGDKYYSENEPLHDKDPLICRARLLENLKQWMKPIEFPSIVAYDLDELNATSVINPYQLLDNNDEDRLGVRDPSVSTLKFESRFECGNLRKALQIGQNEYELILNPDINSTAHYQWFYFEVSNMDAIFPYTFHIINCEKTNSQFNFGMKPLMFSVKEMTLGGGGWRRTGSSICYYKNLYHRDYDETEKTQKFHYTLTFTVVFPHSNDVCYFAYHYPYTYTSLQTDICLWLKSHDSRTIYFTNQELCKSLNGNSVPVLTITSKTQASRDLRPYIFLTGRVHPGESNSSWIMKGTIEYLLSEEGTAQLLRDLYIFKIIPMLNVDGVINGCHRCDLTAEDLNRCWHKPCHILQPTIYHTKSLLQYLYYNSKTPMLYCDYHGHSRKKNIFLYGCCNSQSWCNTDREKPDSGEHEVIPQLLKTLAPAFSLENCVFTVEKSRESTARVTVWREFGIAKSYTMESSYCGCDQGRYKGMHIGIQHLSEMGVKFCQALYQLHSSHLNMSSFDRLMHAASSSDPLSRWDEESTGISDDTNSDSDGVNSKTTSAGI